MTGWDMRWVATANGPTCGYWEVLHRGDPGRATFRYWADAPSAEGVREAQQRARVKYRQVLEEEA